MTDPKALAARFLGDFLFGVATAAYQIEGATKADGRKPCIWDAFANMPGRVFERHNGDMACDHYNRWEQDLDLIQEMGVSAYRFSIAWPRIIPEGTGRVNEAGLDFYDKLVDGLKDRGIKAYATLYHWDLPLALMGDGGWTARSTAYAFQRYAKLVMARLGDRLDAVATFNEPWCSVWLSHLYGVHAPGERNMDAALHALHYTNLAHGLGIDAIRQVAPQVPAGLVLNAHSVIPGSDSAADQAAAERAHQFHNGAFFDPVFKGEYPAEFMASLGDRMPVIENGDLEIISQKLDWWGLNYYTPMRVADNPAEGAEFPATMDAPPVSTVKTDIGWEVYAPALKSLVEGLYDRYTLPVCYITENGACYNMESVDGEVDDQPRLDYYAEHLGVVADLIAEGIPMKGYFAWSLMDNFEWAEGYRMRFGLVHVDYDTQVRTLKNSGKWYSALAAELPKGNHSAE
ncbi:beta-glucosidase [Agrobacterium vitis]|uniref:Beta-glucosidase n=1 Tax=Agrobacterium vitis TaxID=373 RepID=A0A368NU68_AGRVI|nr:GH1 family beta-glucosidase [Agrobacterium vitis]KAA3517676.1 beta-glucosidase [Agrobacterium vitis]KAA3523770.1 beta-glucosidase [Agrobacterium vitis]KAA3524107.1 beta-glucosidase [Agrobacterium vitis]MCF1476885.1 beta-glucosidase [Agrobacterium vitis]MUZ96007.1 beta-glucosidase [Agrobacterium vitis]